MDVDSITNAELKKLCLQLVDILSEGLHRRYFDPAIASKSWLEAANDLLRDFADQRND
jgi:hypothetical protein